MAVPLRTRASLSRSRRIVQGAKRASRGNRRERHDRRNGYAQPKRFALGVAYHELHLPHFVFCLLNQPADEI